MGLGVIPLLLKIVGGGRNKSMMRYSLGALRNLAMESSVQKVMVKEGVLDALVNVWEVIQIPPNSSPRDVSERRVSPRALVVRLGWGWSRLGGPDCCLAPVPTC